MASAIRRQPQGAWWECLKNNYNQTQLPKTNLEYLAAKLTLQDDVKNLKANINASSSPGFQAVMND